MTKMRKKFVYFAIKIFLSISLVANLAHSKQDSTLDLLRDAKVAPISESYYEPTDRGKYLGLSVGIIAVSSLVAIGVLYALPESVSNWNRSELQFGNLSKKYRRNIANSPIIDGDEAWLNYVAHPYVGALYYLQPRMAGFSWVEGVIFSFVASTFYWEYGLECFAEVPSWQDLVLTPALGSLLGEGFYRLIRHIQRNDNRLFDSYFLGNLLLWVLDPIGSVIQLMGGGRNLWDLQQKRQDRAKHNAHFAKWQGRIPSGNDDAILTQIWRDSAHFYVKIWSAS